MGDNDDDNGDVQKFVDALDKTLEERLPEGELATKEDVEEMVDERLKAQEGSPTEGTPERPDGQDESGAVEQDEQYEGDNPDETASDSDKVEEKANGHPSGCMCEDCQTSKSGGYTTDELKSILPDDQFKAIQPLLERAEGDMDDGYEGEEMGEDYEPEVSPEDDYPEEMVDEEVPDDEPELPEEEGEADPVLASKAVDNLDLDRMSEPQKDALLKAQTVEKSESQVRTNTGVGGGAQPAHAGAEPEDAEDVAKATGDAVDGDPALRNIYDEEGKPQI